MMKNDAMSTLILAAIVLSAGHALAHAHLEAETPAADAIVKTGPTALSLTFSERLENNSDNLASSRYFSGE